MKKLVKEEQGNIAVLFAIGLVVLCGMVAMVVDGGAMFLEKSRLQKSLDASALAGAQDLLISQAQAESSALDYADKNGFPLTGEKIETGTDFVEVTEEVEKDLVFARVLSINEAMIPATSRAEISGTLTKREGIVPVGLEATEFSKGSSYSLHYQPGKGSIKGNFGFLDIGDEEANTIRDKIKYGVTMEITEDMREMTEPGLKWGQIQQGFEYRIAQDEAEGQTYCESYETADDSCYRTVILPIVESYSEVNGKSEVRIIGFTAFWIDKIEKHEVKGKFIEVITYGEFSEEEDENEFGVYGVRLVK